jgi:outer membrane protein assembly factor BamB
MRITLVFVALIALRLGAAETNWPEFRGLQGNGIAASTNLPLKWSEKQNVKWNTPIHGKAWSSPVIWGQQVWLTTATSDGHELFAVYVDRDTGKVVQDLKLFDVAKPQFCHPFNSYASPTPAIEAGRIYVTFGAPGTACLDTQTGKVLWTRRDIECNHFRGAGSSPILYSNLFFLNFDGSDHQFILALDKQTGRTVWQRNRSIDYQDLGADGQPEMAGDYRKAFATCQVATFDGLTTLLSQGSKALYAFDPSSGTELWRVEERSSYSGATRPLTGHGLVFVPAGFGSGGVLVVRPGKPGEVLDTKAPGSDGTQLQVVWKTKQKAPKKPSLLLFGDLLFAIDDNGVATCWEAMTGTVVWSERLGGHYSASPLAAGREFKKLAENQLSDGFMASPAVSGDALFLRSRTQLYRLEE